MILAKMCKYRDVRCYHSSCDIFLCPFGSVVCCSHHSNPFGRFSGRKSAGSHSSIFDIWLRSVRC